MTLRTGNHLPPFYRSPAVLCADAHRNKGLLPGHEFEFAAQNTAIPLGVSEFALAIRHYPIVFAPGDFPVPLIVTGLVTGGNLFVSAQDGTWRANTYIPGYLRRYPFILGNEEESGDAPILLDTSSHRFVDASPRSQAIRLFDNDGSPSPFTQAAISLCVSTYRQEAETAAFARSLGEAGILVPGSARVSLADGTVQTVEGFATIDMRAYRALPDTLLRQWFKAGLVDAIALHFASQQNWPLLADLFLERRASRLAQAS